MASIISIHDCEAFDYEAAIDEVEILVPKYLKALSELNQSESFEQIPCILQNLGTYWKRLAFLLTRIQSVEEDPQLEDAIKSSLQCELASLEKIYLKINERISLSKKHWTKALWKASNAVLVRMDDVLQGMGFDCEHRDRAFIRDMQKQNLKRQTECDI